METFEAIDTLIREPTPAPLWINEHLAGDQSRVSGQMLAKRRARLLPVMAKTIVNSG